MKRQRGRGRKPGGGGGGGGGNHNHGNRSLESNGPDVKIRGTAAQIYEKYAQYARDAQSGGDRVKYENYLQHAEHYYRVMAATMPRERLLQQQQEGGGFGQQQTANGEGGQGHDGVVQAGEQQDNMRTSDEPVGDSDEGDDEVEAEAETEASEPQEAKAASSGQDDGQDEGQGQEGAGRTRRRRGRRRPHDGDRPNGGGNGGGDTEARSALDSLARKQGALAGG
jgi:hypothetical protein